MFLQVSGAIKSYTRKNEKQSEQSKQEGRVKKLKTMNSLAQRKWKRQPLNRLVKRCWCGREGDRKGQGESQAEANRDGEDWAKLCTALLAQSHWMDLRERKHLRSVQFLPFLNK